MSHHAVEMRYCQQKIDVRMQNLYRKRTSQFIYFVKAQKMRQTIEATIDEQGNVRLLQPIQLSKPRRAYVTILADERDILETALLSEVSLAEDWDRPEEDAAWSHLHPAPVRLDWGQVRSVVEAAAFELNWNVEISIDTAENLIVVVVPEDQDDLMVETEFDFYELIMNQLDQDVFNSTLSI